MHVLLPVLSSAYALAPVPEVDSLEIVAVVDNVYDCFQKDTPCATRHSLAHHEGFDSIRMQAEMGLAYALRATVDGTTHTLLFDFGLTEEAYAGNLALLEIDPKDAEALVLSHAHQDHYTGLPWVAAETKAPIWVGGEDAFLPRWFVTPKTRWDMGTLTRKSVDRKGTRIQVADHPEVVAGAFVLSGPIERVTDFEKVAPFLVMVQDGKEAPDPMTHELAIGVRVRGKGLVVITACAHVGVMNSVEHLRKLTGDEHVHAVVGGMHLTSASPEQTAATVAALQALDPDFVVPLHCTGDKALYDLRAAMPEAFVAPGTGTVYRFAAP